MQGIRDEPIRMAALRWKVPLHRTLAFTIAGFIAGIAGVLNVWWNGQIDARSISIGPTIDLLIIAVIGGMARLEGAWIGAFIFVAANNYLRSIPLIDRIGMLLDEPTAGLSPLYVELFFQKIAEIHSGRGVTIVLTEQNATLALGVADRAMVLSLGLGVRGHRRRRRHNRTPHGGIQALTLRDDRHVSRRVPQGFSAGTRFHNER